MFTLEEVEIGQLWLEHLHGDAGRIPKASGCLIIDDGTFFFFLSFNRVLVRVCIAVIKTVSKSNLGGRGPTLKFLSLL